jgi:cytochrome c biogenesis protein CcmG/thiol:disulfide interchange protein DsbE
MKRLQSILSTALVLCACALALPAQALSVGETAPLMSVPSLRETKTVNLADYRGKVLYVDFWASWCGPCAQAFPLLDQLRSELGPEGFEVLGVNVDTDVADARRFMKKHVVSFPLLGPVGDDVPTAFGVEGMPYGVVIDRKGVVRSLHLGLNASDVPELRKQLKALLAQAAK